MKEKLQASATSQKWLSNCSVQIDYHALQNHYTHEIIIFELFRGYSYSFRGSSELISITVTVSLFF